MRRAMSYVAPWAGVTTLAVTLSWLGVRDAVRATVSERAAPPPTAGPVVHASPTAAPSPSPGPANEPTAASTARPDEAGAPPEGTQRPAGDVRSYAVRGGQAAMALADGRVRLVSATPNPGFETRVTEARDWLRVDFLAYRTTSSVIATWHGREPTIKVYEY